jgi:hypothetical protein
MSHPSLGLPPPDTSAGSPVAAARLRDQRATLSKLALERALELDPTFATRYDQYQLRRFLRDYEQHIRQVARSVETGDDYYVVQYAEWLAPIYRRREVPMRDFATLVRALADACAAVLSPDDARLVGDLVVRWMKRLKFHARLPGDHKGNPIVRFFWKGAGIADDNII